MYKIYIYDQAPIVAIGLKAIINEIINIEIISITNCNKFIAYYKESDINLLFLEINKKGTLDKNLLLRIRQEFPNLKIVLFTDYERHDEIKEIITSIANCSFLSKKANKEEIFESIITNLFCNSMSN